MENTDIDNAEFLPKSAASQFVRFRKGKGYEKGQTQPFWLHLPRVLGVDTPEAAIEFEDKAHIDAAHGFIDGYIPATRVMIEQKSLGKSLRAGILQSDGSVLTPFQQAKRYCFDLPLSRHPRWVVTCNFAEFLIYDMERPNAEPESLLLENLPDELYRLKFLTDTGSETIRREEEISKKAGEVVGLIYDTLLKQYEVKHTDLLTPDGVRDLGGAASGRAARRDTAPTMADMSRVSGEQIRVLKPLFDGDRVSYVPHISPYLLPVDDIWIESRAKPLCGVPEIRSGGKPVEGGHLIFTPEEKAAFLKEEPSAARFFRRLTGSEEYINGIERWCLWLHGISPTELRAMPHVVERVRLVREMRLASVKPATRKAAETPWQFMEIKEPGSDFIIVPKVSSEQRRYVPLGFLHADTVPTDLAFFVPDATLYHFGVLTSNVHMAWMRAVAGRLKSDYRYSAQIVYNNFPWPFECKMENGEWRIGDEGSASSAPPRLCVEKISSTVQAILDARAKYPDSSLADLYDELTMPPDLRRAHQENDRAVMAAYGFSTKMTESECVAELFKRYQKLVEAKGKDQ